VRPSPAIASLLAEHVGVPADQMCVGNGACEVIHALPAGARGPLLISLPTFSAYYEFAGGYAPETVVIINPNNPDGGLLAHAALVDFVERLGGRVRQVIVDESFGAFTTEDTPATLAPLVAELPHLVVVNSLSKSHGIAGPRLGYASMTPARTREIRAASLWNISAFAEWFCGLLGDRDYLRSYESARRRYVRETRRLFDALDEPQDTPERGELRAPRARPPRRRGRDRAAGPPRCLRPRLRRQAGPEGGRLRGTSGAGHSTERHVAGPGGCPARLRESRKAGRW
jgi:histidinol-phosphate/aromatic aminotransferase/cobyric acid decarboxylase-like protein